MNNFIKFSDSAQKVLNYAGEITKKMKGNRTWYTGFCALSFASDISVGSER